MDRDDRPVLEVRDLWRSYGRFKRVDAVRGVSFAVQAGQNFGLIGPDGAGKTSIIQTLAGVLRPHRGSAWVEGLDVMTDSERVKQCVGYMPQGLGSNFYETLTVDENIEFFRDLRELPGGGLWHESRGVARGHTARALSRSARRQSLRRHAAEAGAHLHADSPPRCAAARRADDGRRSGIAPGVLADHPPRGGRARHDRPAEHVVHGRSRTLPPDRAVARGDDCRPGHAGSRQAPGGRPVRAPDRRAATTRARHAAPLSPMSAPPRSSATTSTFDSTANCAGLKPRWSARGSSSGSLSMQEPGLEDVFLQLVRPRPPPNRRRCTSMRRR